MSNEIIQIITCNNYDGFQHFGFIFSQKIILILKGLS